MSVDFNRDIISLYSSSRIYRALITDINFELVLSSHHYLFRDASGTVDVEIDHKYLNGVRASPQDQVEIQRKVDKEWNQVSLGEANL